MHIGIATDIYGVQDSVQRIAHALRCRGAAVTILSPYTQIAPSFFGEEEAYDAFMSRCGHERYGEMVLAALQNEGWEAVVGYSAGASAVWQALAGRPVEFLQHFIGLYPTRIRKHLERMPQTATTLIFPRFEKVLDVDKLMNTLAGIENIRCLKAPYLHGFLNPLSANYSIEGAAGFAEIFSSPDILCKPAACRGSLAALLAGKEQAS
jgi:dienelactone hydrolase